MSTDTHELTPAPNTLPRACAAGCSKQPAPLPPLGHRLAAQLKAFAQTAVGPYALFWSCMKTENQFSPQTTKGSKRVKKSLSQTKRRGGGGSVLHCCSSAQPTQHACQPSSILLCLPPAAKLQHPLEKKLCRLSISRSQTRPQPCRRRSRKCCSKMMSPR
jgi:hypothetical protein